MTTRVRSSMYSLKERHCNNRSVLELSLLRCLVYMFDGIGEKGAGRIRLILWEEILINIYIFYAKNGFGKHFG